MIGGTIAICLAIQISATGADFPPTKIGFVDREQLYKAPRVEEKLIPIRDRKKEIETEIDRQWEDLMEKIRDFESKKMYMDEEDREEKEAELKAGRDEILKFIEDKQDALEQQRDEAMREILTDIRGFVRRVAEERGYTLVLWKSAIAYGAEEYDLTQHVMTLLLQEEEE